MDIVELDPVEPKLEELQVISKKEWSKMPTVKGGLDLWIPVTKIVFLYGTNTEECHSKQDCMQLLQKMQLDDFVFRKHPDINHNFLIGGDGNVYEGRGWGFRCSPRTDLPYGAMVITYIGDFAVDDPPLSMLITANQFITKHIGDKKISPAWKKFYERGY